MNKQQRLYRNGQKVDILYRWVRDSKTLIEIPQLVKQIIGQKMWREHQYEKTGEIFKFESFQEFVEKHPPDGLGTTIKTLCYLCRDDPVAINMIDEELKGSSLKGSMGAKKGTIKITNVVKPSQRRTGASRQAGLRTLRRRAESDKKIAQLRDKVLSGELTVNAALVASGLRAKRMSIPKDIDQAAKAIKKAYTKKELNELMSKLLKK